MWTTATLSDSDMDWHYLCHGASEALPTCLPFAALDSDGTHHSHHLKYSASFSDHGVNSLYKYRRKTRDGHGLVPECSISDLPGVTRVAAQAPHGHRALRDPS